MQIRSPVVAPLPPRHIASSLTPTTASPIIARDTLAPLVSVLTTLIRDEALRVLPDAKAVDKYKDPHNSFSYMRARDGTGPWYRVSKTMHHGSFSKMRVAVDEDQNAWAFLVLHPFGNKKDANTPVGQTPFEELMRTHRMLNLVDSPTKVLDTFVDDKARIYRRMRLFGPDAFTAVFSLGSDTPLYKDSTSYRSGIVSLMHDMAQATLPLHQKDLVHLDIKPENFFLNKDGESRVVLGDYGSVTRRWSRPAGVPQGSLGYMAPEVLLPGLMERLDQSTDIYSLGLVFARLVNGEALHRFAGRDTGTDAHDFATFEDLIADLSVLQTYGFARTIAGTSRSMRSLVDTYHLLNDACPLLGEFVMSRMLASTPTRRPTLLRVTQVLSQILSPKDLQAGRHVLHEQVDACEKTEQQINPAREAERLRQFAAQAINAAFTQRR